MGSQLRALEEIHWRSRVPFSAFLWFSAAVSSVLVHGNVAGSRCAEHFESGANFFVTVS